MDIVNTIILAISFTAILPEYEVELHKLLLRREFKNYPSTRGTI